MIGAPVKALHGTFHATVHNTNDPKGLNRIQLKIPQVLGNAISQWAVPHGLVQPIATPAVGTAVHATFLGGDPSHPAYSLSTQTPTLFASYDGQVAQDDPVAWWKLADATGATSVLDSSGNGYNGTPTNVTFQQAQAVASNPSAGFNGTTSNIVTTYSPPAFTAFTVEIWVNLNGQTQSSSFPQVISNSNSSAGAHKGFEIYVNATAKTPTINLGNGTTWNGFSLGPALPATGWVHLVATWDGHTVTCYQNGVTASTTAWAGPFVPDSDVVLATNIGNTGNQYAGLISEAIIYNTALSMQRVLAHYQAQSQGVTAANIAGGTITAAEIAAGTIVAGIVDGTTIQGATLIADGTNAEILAYDGSPAAGNLLFALSPQPGSDSFGNPWVQGIQLGLPNQNQIVLNPNAAQPFNILPPFLAGTLEAVAQFTTPDTNQMMPGMLGSVLFDPTHVGTTAKQGGIMHSPFNMEGAAVVLEGQNDAGTDTPLIQVGSVAMQAGAMNFSPWATFLPYAALFYSGASAQTVQTFTTGTTWTCPTGVTQIKVECWGAGAGGNVGASGTFYAGGNGGGGGEYAAEYTLTVVPGTVYTIMIGAGGQGFVNGLYTAQDGGNTEFSGGTITPVIAHGGQAVGPGGTGSTNSVHHDGGSGGLPGPGDPDTGAGGGSSAGTAANGTNGSSHSQTGGTAPAGGGNGGKGGGDTSSPAPGTDGASPGGGGGGAGQYVHLAVVTYGVAGSGANGFMRITYSTGAPTLLASLSAGAGTDQFGTAYPGGFNINGGKAGNIFAVGVGPSDFEGTVYLENGTQPATPGTAAALYAISGHLKYVGIDGNAYTTGTKQVVAYPGQTITGTSYGNVTGASVPVAALHYRFKATVILGENNSTGGPSFQFTMPSTTGNSGIVAKYFKNVGAGTTSVRDNTFTGGVTSMGTAAGLTQTGQGQVVELECDATFSAAGTLQLQAETSTSGGSFTIQAVYIELYPVV